MRIFGGIKGKTALTAARRWLARAGGISSPEVALAAYLMIPVAHAADKPVESSGRAAAVGNAAVPASPASAQGSWNFVMKTPVGERKVSFMFVVEGNVLKGTMTDDEGSSEIFKGSVEGATLKWSAKVSRPMSMTLEFTGVINGDVLTGAAKGMLGSAKFTGARA